MYLENLIKAEDKKSYLASLTDSEKTTLFSEVEKKKKELEEEKIKLETTLARLNEDEAAQMEKLKAMGISNYNDLDLEIRKLEDSIDTELIKYAESIQGE